ncbi:response regulator transcription factor [Variovorax saccharolyticus]|uniref:response regulator transcription factor n=1 Tax=Variovorax saccharolyticus TaxID=3053516 RepID=UPI002575EF31|nr:response regulator [Variovorax sp. J31P216]MDM0029713.1 response regulator [Variovorax sp. J31P216]
MDDDASFLAAATRLLRASGFEVVAFDSPGALLAQCDSLQAGCLVADLLMPGMSGLELQAAIARTRNPVPIVFLTGRGDIASTVQAMRNGAEDFLEKRAPKEALLDAVRRALARGQRERQERERHRAVQQRFATLSARELQVLAELLRGRLNKQIAGDLGIHERTVKLHRRAIMTKCSVGSIAELTQLAQGVGVWRQDAPPDQGGATSL